MRSRRSGRHSLYGRPERRRHSKHQTQKERTLTPARCQDYPHAHYPTWPRPSHSQANGTPGYLDKTLFVKGAIWCAARFCWPRGLGQPYHLAEQSKRMVA